MEHDAAGEDSRTPVMPDAHDVLQVLGVEDLDHVAGQVLHSIGLDIRRLGTVAVAQAVGRYDAVAGFCEGLDLMVPEVTGGRVTVNEEEGGHGRIVRCHMVVDVSVSVIRDKGLGCCETGL